MNIKNKIIELLGGITPTELADIEFTHNVINDGLQDKNTELILNGRSLNTQIGVLNQLAKTNTVRFNDLTTKYNVMINNSPLLDQIKELKANQKFIMPADTTKLLKFYDEKYPTKTIYYAGYTVNFKGGPRKITTRVSDFITTSESMKQWLVDNNLMYKGDYTKESLSKHSWTLTDFYCETKMYYETDIRTYGFNEHWIPNNIQWYIRKGDKLKADCFTGDTKIIVYSIVTKSYDYVKITELNLSEHLAVSYNESKQKIEFKKIINIVNKGKQKIKKVKMNLGGEFRCTNDHKISCFVNPNSDPSIKYKPLSDFSLDKNKSGSNQIPSILRLPELNSIIMDEDYLKLQGIYCADGYARRENGDSFCLAGDTQQFVDENKTILNNLDLEYTFNDIPQHKYYNVRGNTSWGIKGVYKHFDNNISGLPINQIKILLKPYLERDAYIMNKTKELGNRSWCIDDKYIMATVSDKLATQLKILHLILGKHCYSHIDNYQYSDAVRQPIHRIHTSTTKKELLNGLTNKRIKSIEDAGEEDVYDIEVDDNHNFFLAETGVLVHNCENHDHMVVALIELSGVPEGFARAFCGKTNSGFGHSSLTCWDWRTGKYEQWETTAKQGMVVPEDHDIYIKSGWFSFTSKRSWSNKPKLTYKSIK